MSRLTVNRLIGIGNAAMDVVAVAPEDFEVLRLGLKKGHCVFLSDAGAAALNAALEPWGIEYVPGGSAANVLACYGALGGQGRFIGKIADDECGRLFTRSMTDWGVVFDTPAAGEGFGSTRIFTVVSPDGERSFAASYGASHVIAEDDVQGGQIADAAMLLIDGYMLMSENGPKVLRRAIALAKEHCRPIVFLPADMSVIEARREDTTFILSHADGVICNAEQALALTHTGDIDSALAALARSHEFGCVTLGADGVRAFAKGRKYVLSNPYQPDAIVSTNGAGDNFAGGFLYGYLHGMGIEAACRLGMFCALEILKQQSPRPMASFAHLLERIIIK